MSVGVHGIFHKMSPFHSVGRQSVQSAYISLFTSPLEVVRPSFFSFFFLAGAHSLLKTWSQNWP